MLITVLSIAWVGLLFLFQLRINQAHKFRMRILEEDSNYWIHAIHERRSYPGSFPWYDSLESYTKMILKFWRPLKSFIRVPIDEFYDQYWTKELLDKL